MFPPGMDRIDRKNKIPKVGSLAVLELGMVMRNWAW